MMVVLLLLLLLRETGGLFGMVVFHARGHGAGCRSDMCKTMVHPGQRRWAAISGHLRRG